jgi:RHS repeat-associated protein
VTWGYGPGTGTPLTQSESASAEDERFYAVVADQVGMPAELVAADGTVAGYQQHTVWGGTLWRPGGAATPLRFPGQYHDPETGLHYHQQRYYDPVTGSYLTPDPLGLGPAPNPHAYVPNPLVQAGPLGTGTCCVGPATCCVGPGLNSRRLCAGCLVPWAAYRGAPAPGRVLCASASASASPPPAGAVVPQLSLDHPLPSIVEDPAFAEDLGSCRCQNTPHKPYPPH